MEHGEELWLGAPQTQYTPVLPGPGAEPQRKLLTPHYRSRRRDCFTSDFERFDVMPRRLTDCPNTVLGQSLGLRHLPRVHGAFCRFSACCGSETVHLQSAPSPVRGLTAPSSGASGAGAAFAARRGGYPRRGRCARRGRRHREPALRKRVAEAGRAPPPDAAGCGAGRTVAANMAKPTRARQALRQAGAVETALTGVLRTSPHPHQLATPQKLTGYKEKSIGCCAAFRLVL